MIGSTISHYKIVRKLGEGGMGIVYRAEDTTLHRPVVLKFLTQQGLSDETARMRFAQEARAAANLNHPHIATIYEYNEPSGPSDATPFIAMEYVEGETLKEKIERGRFSVAETIDIIRQVASGLQEAHRLKIIHRDIKPANIIIKNDGTVKILDFGVAKFLGSTKITAVDKIVGSFAYMSPEQIRGEEVDGRTDIWALGVVLFEMLTQQLPFKGDYPPAVMYSITHEETTDLAEIRTDIPDSLLRLFHACVEKDPAERPNSIEEVLSMLSGRVQRRRFAFPKPRAVRRGIVVTLAVLAVGGIIWYAGSKFSSSAPQEPPGKLRIAVLQFENTMNQPETAEWGATLQTLFVNGLSVEGLAVVDPQSFNELLRSSLGTEHPVAEKDLKKINSAAGLSLAIDGVIAKSPDGYRIQAKVVDPANGEVTFSREAPASTEANLPSAVEGLTTQILDFFQVRALISGKNKDLSPWFAYKTQNIAALKAFIQASKYIYRVEAGGEKYLRSAIELDSLFVSPRIWLISTLIGHGQPDSAKAHYAFLLRHHQTSTPFEQAMIDWAGAYIDGNVSQQAQHLQTALEFSPGNNILLFNLARVKFIMEDYPGAIRALEPATGARWHYSPAYYLEASCYNNLKEYARARDILEGAMGIEPVYRGNYSFLATIYFRDKDTAHSSNYEKQFILRSREHGDSLKQIYGQLAQMYDGEGLYERSVDLYRDAIALDKSNPEFHGLLADALFRKGRFAESRRECDITLRLDSNRVNAYFTLAQIFENSGDTTGALRYYHSYIKRDSASSVAKTILTHIANLKR